MCPPNLNKSIVLFRDRMVTNCLLFYSERQDLNFPIRTVFFLFRQAGNM